MKRPLGLGFIALITLSILLGCGGGGGGGGGGGQQGTQVRFTIRWAERSRNVAAPSSALSAVVTLKNARADGTDFVFTINRDASNTAAYTRTYTSVDFAMPGTWELGVRFFAQANGAGDVVGTAAANVTLAPDGTGIGDIATTGTVASVKVTENQTVFVGATKSLAYETRSADNALIAVTPGSVFFQVASGGDKLRITETQLAEGLAEGTATVRATVDGKTSPEASVAVAFSVAVSVSPASVTAGDKPTGTVTLPVDAPTGGAVVTLVSSNSVVAAVPSSVTVAAGRRTQTFTVTTHSVAESTPITITATYVGTGQSTTFTVLPAGLLSVTVTPSSVAGGRTVTGKVTMTGEAPPGGADVTLSSSNAALAAVPASVNVPQGTLSATFTVTTTAVTKDEPVTISATFAGATKTTTLTIKPVLDRISFNPNTVAGGNTSTGTVTLLAPAPEGGAKVDLSSDKPTIAPVPASVTVGQGATSVNFTVTTTSVIQNEVVTVSATYAGVTKTGRLTVKPLLEKVSLNPTMVVGGLKSQGTVTLAGPAPASGAKVDLRSDNAALASVPASVTVEAGKTVASFEVSTTEVTANASAVITATHAGVSRTASLSVRPYLNLVTVAPATLIGGNPSQGTVSFNGPAPAGGAVVTLSSSKTTAATVPAEVSVPEGQTTATFPITTFEVDSNEPVDITASYRGVSRSDRLTVRPLLDKVSLNPTVVKGGEPSQGTVALNGPAPAGGAEIALSSNRAEATVPASVTIPAGQTSATFPVTTVAVAREVKATIKATKGAANRNAVLTIQP